jgi:electron transport complex protein RnfD
MLCVILALLPACIYGVFNFGFHALLILCVSTASAVIAEALYDLLFGKKGTVKDLSAVVTGLLIGMNMPPEVPLFVPVLGSVFGIIVVKQLFGGIGQNFANPAITARIIMMTAFSGAMTSWVFPDAVSTATPLAAMAKGDIASVPSYLNLFLGYHGGCLGETCALALLLGGAYLLIRRVISWHTPVAFIGTVAIMSLICGKDVPYQLLSGGLLLGAIFMATDYSSTPPTKWGKIIFGVGCGLITILIRFWGNFPEGVSFSILLMNIFTPYITKLTRPRPLTGGADNL